MRAESKIPAWPMTRSRGSPVFFIVRYAIVSSGLVNTMKMAFGECFNVSVAALPTISALVFNKSSRLMPGLRAIPAVIMMMSEPLVSA